MPAPIARQINSWTAAEENAAAWMAYWRYTGVRLTSGGSDNGVDVRADGAIAQVKFEAAQVGRPQLQRLIGARGLDYTVDTLFFTGAGYSAHALQYASEMGLALFIYSLDGTMTAVNEAAVGIFHQSAEGEQQPERAQATMVREIRGEHSSAQTLPKSTPTPSWRRPLIMIGVGALFLWSSISGAFKSENWSAGAGPIAVGVGLLLGGLLLCVFGMRKLRRALTTGRDRFPRDS